MNEKWSDKYKKSIDCSNPKGFSQKAHCQGRKKTFKEFREYMAPFGVGIGPVDTIKPMASMGSQGQFFPNKKYRGLYATYQGPGFGTHNPTSSLNTKREYFSQPRTLGKSGYGPAHPLNPRNKPSLMTKLKHMWQKKEDTNKPILNASKKSDELEHMKLMTKALKTMPGSQKQSEIKKQINVIRKRLGLRPISEDTNIDSNKKEK